MPMLTMDLTYAGGGIHEELIAYVADQEGYYEDEGVHVAIRDGIDGKRSVCAAARRSSGPGPVVATDPWHRLESALRQHRSSAVLVSRRTRVKSMADLRGRRLAVHAAHTAPGCFARIVLRKHGLDPDRDLECVARAPGDYQMDLRRLRDGSIDAAYVGSTLSPEQVAAEEGFSVLSWVGDHFQIPTVGIVVDLVAIPLDDPALQALVRANRRALAAIAEKPDLAVDPGDGRQERQKPASLCHSE